MKVAVNVRALLPGRIGGLEPAFRNTLAALQDAADVRFTLVTSHHNHHTLAETGGALRRVLTGEDPRELEAALAGHDVLWCPFLVLEPERPPLPAVGMIPDLQHQQWPEFFSRDELTNRLRRYRMTAAWSKRVLTLSEFCKRHLLETYHLPDDHVVVVPLDCGREFHDTPPDPARQAALRAQHGLPARYLLFPANTWPHKNHRGLLRALHAYRERFGEPPALALTGADIGSVDVQRELEAHGLERHVHRLGYVPKADMPHLYDGAACLVFCTLFEGFGIPVVEAFRRGTPVVASNTTSIPELAAGCARLVDPQDPAAIAQAIHATLTDEAGTRELVARGRARAQRYGYAIAADRTLAALREAAAQPPQLVAARRPGATPKVFVVTPSFNQGRFLQATIDSVLAQDWPNLEYFVADGGSTDESVAILQGYGDRVRWRSGPDGGQSAAIAAAWRASDAEIVAWLNSDDTFLPGAVRAGVEHLLAHPEHAMVYGRAWYTDVEGRQTEPYPTRPFDRDQLAGECFICQPATFLRREVFHVIDLPDPSLRYCMDYDLWIRLSERFGVGFLDRYLATSRMYAENKTLGERDGVYREIMAVARRHFGFVAQSWVIGHALYQGRRLAERFFWFLPARARAWLQLRFAGRRRRRQVEPGPPFGDGWAGARTLVRVQPDAQGRATIRGESPMWPFRAPLAIRVLEDGRPIARAVVRERGPFTIEVHVAARRLQPVALVLEANRTFVPLRHRLGADPRPLAFRLAPLAGEAG